MVPEASWTTHQSFAFSVFLSCGSSNVFGFGSASCSLTPADVGSLYGLGLRGREVFKPSFVLDVVRLSEFVMRLLVVRSLNSAI